MRLDHARLEPDAKSTIVDLRVATVTVPINEPVRLSFGTLDRRRTMLVEIEVADGTIGYGESWVNWPPWSHTERAAAYVQAIRPHVLGREARNIESIRHDLESLLRPMGEQAGAMGPVHQAVSGVDLALWDLAGKLSGKSVAALLGTNSSAVSVYASSIGPGPDIESRCQGIVEAGFNRAKIRVGFGLDRDRDLLHRIRTCVGDRLALIADANRAWTLQEAERMAATLSEYGIVLVEEPLNSPDLNDIERFFEATGLQVAVGENLYDVDDYRTHALSRAVAALQPDAAKNGGLTLLRAVGEIAQTADVLMMPHCYGGPLGFYASLHLMAGLGLAGAVEFPIGAPSPFWGMVGGIPEVRNGRVDLPSENGFAFEPHSEWLDAHATYHSSFEGV